MSIIAYTGQDEYDVVHESQDCRGWTVTDQAGNNIGKVSDLLVDTERMRVDSIVIDGKARIAAEDIMLGNNESVVVRGVHDVGAYANANSGGKHDETGYATLADQDQYRSAGYVSGVTRAANEEEITLPIIEEQMVVGKRTVDKGSVNVRTTMTENPIEETVNLREENVTVERHKVDRAVDSGTGAFEETSFDVTTQAEVPVVSKEARVVEEVVIDKETIERDETVRDSVKRTDVEIDEIDAKNIKDRRNI